MADKNKVNETTTQLIARLNDGALVPEVTTKLLEYAPTIRPGLDPKYLANALLLAAMQTALGAIGPAGVTGWMREMADALERGDLGAH